MTPGAHREEGPQQDGFPQQDSSPRQGESDVSPQHESLPTERRRTLISSVPLALVIALCAGFFLYDFALTLQFQLNDPDLWWHLKTGEQTLSDGQLPTGDPFSMTTPRVLNKGQLTGLRGAWLGQVLFALADRAGGLNGVWILRGVLIVLPMAVGFLWLIANRVRWWLSLLVVLLPAAVLNLYMFYSFERPQAFSFLLVAVLVMLLLRIRRVSGEGREGRGRFFDYSYPAVVVLMALWSNLHAGFLVGCYVIVIHVFSEALLLPWYRYRGKPGQAASPVFFGVCIAALLATGLNPGGFTIFISYSKGLLRMFSTDVIRYATGGDAVASDWVRSVVLEYKPLTYFYQLPGFEWLEFYWAYTVIAFAALGVSMWARRTFDLPALLTVGFLSLFANMYARGLMFSLTVLPLYLGAALSTLYQKEQGMPGRTAGRRVVMVRNALLVLLIISTAGLLTFQWESTRDKFLLSKPDNIVSEWYPEAMTEFIAQNNLIPPMYNYYTWGGYMIYRLYPQYKVFIDGRALDNAMSTEADVILKAGAGWRQSLDGFGVNFIATPVVFRESGIPVPLTLSLIQDGDWKLIFMQDNSAVFLRNIAKNQPWITAYQIDKVHIHDEILSLAKLFISARPPSPEYLQSLVDSLIALKRFDEASDLCGKIDDEQQAAFCQERVAAAAIVR